MQAAGGLKKRKRRNIAKVTGSDVVLYDRNADIYDPFASNGRSDSSHGYGAPFQTRIMDNGDISINMSRYNQQPQEFRYSRVTRDPRFASGGSPLEIEDAFPKRPLSVGGSSNSSEYQGYHNRPVLLSPKHIARLKNIMVMGFFSFAFQWRYNSKTNQVERFGPFMQKLWITVWTLTTIQSACITVFQFYSFFARMNTDESGSWRPVFMSSFSVLWYCYSLSFSLCMVYHREDFRNYINTMLDMNKKLVSEYLITTEGHKEGGQILLNISIPTNIMQTFISISLFLTFPNSPWYLYNYIYSPDHGWWWLVPGAIQEFLCVGQIVSEFLLTAWIVVAHSNTVEFWLQEAHKSRDSGMTRDELRIPNNLIKIYRTLQILTTQFNSAIAPMALPIIKWTNWTALIPCGYVLIRSMNNKFIDEFPGILTYPLGVIVCATTSYAMLQIAARSFDIAASCLTSWSETRHKALRQILISCPLLKVKVAKLYYVTTLTTMTYFQSCLDYIINAIMSFP